ncbi:MAG: leucyl/phenylalanyl-tRNA--protein transferase [Candidatus Dadabacteria bacterium]|nr:leucyl/phenylalanyl-tRNA--protein transferase [Candidatus Dadabacteria bacterium]
MTVYFLDSRIMFPDPSEAEPGGLLAVGGDLSPERLLLAYENGIFPWYSEEDPILWFSPDPRMIFLPGDFKFSKTLLKTVSSGKFSVRADTDFAAVVENCAQVQRKGQSGTWITEEMKAAYGKLHELGYAHSLETYLDGKLVGGLYGVSLGGAFFGESMFHLETDASKVALFHLTRKCWESGFDFIDSQVPTDHMRTLGGREISRKEFLSALESSLEKKTLRGRWEL